MLSLVNTYGPAQELEASRRTDTAANVSTTTSSRYAYDDERRLTQVEVDAGSTRQTETFTLDGVGNRTAHSPVAGAWRYDANNRLLQRGTPKFDT